MAKTIKKKSTVKKASKKKSIVSSTPKNFVVVSNKSYGAYLRGTQIYYEGKKPTSLRDDGSISFGKNILEMLKKTYKSFHWILTEDTNNVMKEGSITKVRTSVKTIKKMYALSYDRSRDVKIDIIKKTFSILYPGEFSFSKAQKYKPGTFAEILNENILSSLSSDDKDALNKFLPEYISKESVSSVNLLKASTQIKTLKEIAAELKSEIASNRSESWWQTYIHKNILVIQQGYIHAIEKMNVIVGGTKFPDFSLITHDSFLDILEIKKPSTPLIKEDNSRNNFYWDTEISKAIIQVENYIENISKNADSVRSYIKDEYSIELKIVRPRGIILAGNSSDFDSQKKKDDYRLLTQASKNIIFLTFDELVTRLENYIEVLEKYSAKQVK